MSFFDYPSGADPAAAPDGFLTHASDEDWDLLRAHAEALHVAPGQTVVHEGVAERALYIVVEGALEAIVPGRRGRAVRVSTMAAGTVLGEVGFLDGLPRSAAVRAVTDARLLRLTYESFESLSAKEPALGRQILLDIGRVLAGRLRVVEALD
jgi:CRP/FNR family cyclic AMP-dependent transcriptional regulator